MDLVAAEWIKLRSVPSTWLLGAGAVVVTALISLLGITGLTAEWHSNLPADFDPTAIGFKGILVGQILVATLGALAITNEYATGQLTGTLTVVPRRRSLLVAKLAVTVAISLGFSVAAVACSFATSQAALAAAGLPSAAITDPHVVRALVCAVGYLALTGILGLAFGVLTRSSSGALAVVVSIALIIPAVAPGLPGALGRLAASHWPTTAAQNSYATVMTGGVAPGIGIAIMAYFTMLSVLIANVAFGRRDA